MNKYGIGTTPKMKKLIQLAYNGHLDTNRNTSFLNIEKFECNSLRCAVPIAMQPLKH